MRTKVSAPEQAPSFDPLLTYGKQVVRRETDLAARYAGIRRIVLRMLRGIGVVTGNARMQQIKAQPNRLFAGTNRWLVLIGIAKLFKAVLFVALGFGALHLVHRDLVSLVTHWIVDLRFDPEGRFVNRILDKIALISPHRLKMISVGIFGYASLDVLEGVGLVLGKGWAEYLTLIVTASFLPWEFFEILRKPNWPKVVLTLLNIAVVVYLAAYLQRRIRERAALHHQG